MKTRQYTLGVIAVITTLVAGPLRSQSGDPVFMEEIDVAVVNVEVVVTDRDGQPVTDLSRDDFQIFDDGKPVEISNFYVAEGLPAGASAEASIAAGTEAGADVLPASTTQALNLVVFVDNLGIQPQNRRLLFEGLRRDLEQHLGNGHRVMLVALGQRLEVALDFTDDFSSVSAVLAELEKDLGPGVQLDAERRMLLTRINQANVRDSNCRSQRPPASSGGSGSTGGSSGGGGTPIDPVFDEAVRMARELAISVRTLAEHRYQNSRNTIAALASFVDTLGGLPGRKAMLYLSDGVPMRPADSMLEAWIAKYDNWFQQNEFSIRRCSRYPDAPGDFRQVFTSLGSSQFDLRNDFGRLTARASDNRVAFYPVSAGDRGSSYVSASNSAGGAGGQVLRSAMVAEGASRAASLLQMAEDTGGLAFTGTTNVGEALRRLSGDFSSFYSLGYTAPEGGRDGEFRDLEIKVVREGVVVRHVNGYHAKTWRDRLGDMTVAAALYGIEQNPLGIVLAPEPAQKKGKRFKMRILVQIPMSELVMVSDGEKYDAQLTLLTVTRDKRGGFSKPQRFDLPIQIPNAAILQARQQAAAFPLELEVDKDAEIVAVSVRDHFAQTASCVRMELDLPVGKSKKKRRS